MYEKRAGTRPGRVCILLTGALATLTLLSLSVFAQAPSLPSEVELYAGEVAVYTTDRDIERVAIGYGDLVEVTTIEQRQIVLISSAGSQGFTALHLWFTDGTQRTVDIRVNPDNTAVFSSTIRQILGPDSRVNVEDIDGKVVISGELNAQEAQQVAKLKELYPNIVDLSHADAVNMQPMVLMDVRVMEMRRDRLRELGIAWQSSIDGPSGGLFGDFTTSFFRVLPEGSPFAGIDLPNRRINPFETHFGLATTIASRINLLATTGHAWELANPQLSTRSGGTANFLSGGRIPIPIVGAFGQTSVQFEDFGVILEISPVVNGDNQILTTLYTEVSEPDDALSVGGIPGFRSRETEAEINVNDGETIVISGLIDLSAVKGYEGIPGLSRIPILGRLFRSDTFRAGQSDLVIFVTPRVVTPDSPENREAIDKSNRMLEGLMENIRMEIFE